MFRKFHEKLKEHEEGFTLIELLVVILIIAILAAIAIPVFLRQREKGWQSQVQSAVKNMATAQESFATSNNGAYTANVSDLVSEGFNYNSASVNVAATTSGTGSALTYCVSANSDNKTAIVYHLNSTDGEVATGPCTGLTITAN